MPLLLDARYSAPKKGLVSASLSAAPAPFSTSMLTLSAAIVSASSVFCKGHNNSGKVRAVTCIPTCQVRIVVRHAPIGR